MNEHIETWMKTLGTLFSLVPTCFLVLPTVHLCPLAKALPLWLQGRIPLQPRLALPLSPTWKGSLLSLETPCFLSLGPCGILHLLEYWLFCHCIVAITCFHPVFPSKWGTLKGQVAWVVKNPAASAGDVRDAGLTPGLGRSPGGGPGNPLQYSCLENPMDRGARRATVLGVSKSWTWLNNFTCMPSNDYSFWFWGKNLSFESEFKFQLYQWLL